MLRLRIPVHQHRLYPTQPVLLTALPVRLIAPMAPPPVLPTTLLRTPANPGMLLDKLQATEVGRHQADRQINLCLVGIGDLVNLSQYEDTQEPEIAKAVDIFLGASFHDCHAIGGPCAVLMVHSPETCVEFVKRLHFVSMDYVDTCKNLAKNDKVRSEIDRYHNSLKRLSDWVQAQYFR